jgi:hypothetical protein
MPNWSEATQILSLPQLGARHDKSVSHLTKLHEVPKPEINFIHRRVTPSRLRRRLDNQSAH